MTLALASTDVRFLPLPPAFNARPFTMYGWVRVFGFPVIHTKDTWLRNGSRVEVTPEAVALRHIVRGWVRDAPQQAREAAGSSLAAAASPSI